MRLPVRRLVRRALLAGVFGAATLAALAGGAGVAAQQAPFDSSLYSGLKWRHVGPYRGGRVDAVSGVAGRPNEFYFGSVNGGVWKSVDAGRIWRPVFDGQPVASIGALSVAPSSPDTVYVGTGESTLRDSVGYGNGMYKSTDAGRTWTHIGLIDTEHIGKIAVDPKDANTVFVAAIGHLYTASAERGVFRSRDGGRTWQKVLFKNNDVGAVDVAIDPRNSQVIYASLWNTRRPPWYTYAPSNGPGGGLFKSTDGGTTWNQLTAGLPTGTIGRSGIAIAPSNPQRLYAVIDVTVTSAIPPSAAPEPPPGRGQAAAAAPASQTAAGGAGRGAGQPAGESQGGLYRSDDAGATWTKMSGDNALWGRGWYLEKIAVDPRNADIVYVPNVSVSRSMDGGRNWLPLRGSPGGDDYHQAWVSPDDSNTMIVASDQGAIVTRNATAEDPTTVGWSSWLNQPTAQIYHVSSDYSFPYWVTGAQQDSGAVAVRTRGLFAEISLRDWYFIGAGGESGMTAGDPLHPGLVFGGTGSRWDVANNLPVAGSTAPQAPETARTDWTQPLVFSRADPHSLYYANQFLFKTTDEARTWNIISPDLTRADPGVPATLDASAASDIDRNGRRGVIYTIAPSPVRAPLIWIGTDDGQIQVTSDDGKTWQNVTPAAVTSWSRVTMMEASHTDANEAYASIDRHQLQDFKPYLYRTRDAGRTWQAITRGLPADGYFHTIKEDPIRKGLLFAGSERGVYLSFDDGDSWQSLQLNLPVTSMRDLEVHENDLIVATHGRGFWIIDDISPLRQINQQVAAAEAFLFKPADAINVLQGGDNGTPIQKDEPQAANPPGGAMIDYYVKPGVTGPVTLDITDADGNVRASFSSDPAAVPATGVQAGGRGGRAGGGIPNTTALWRPAPEPFSGAPGMHRVSWSPTGGGARGGGGRGGRAGGAAAPATTGTFTAKLTVSGKSYTQTFAMKADPRAR